MQKQLSKKSHKATQSSIDDFMKHIRKYNLQSERYISPKPLLYMYSNPLRNGTLHTLQKSRSKSKTLSNRQHSNSKKSNSKTIRQKVQKMLSIGQRQNVHKKSVSSISNKNQKSIKKLNKSTAQIDLTKSKSKLKSKINEFKLKPMTVSSRKIKKTKSKLQQPHTKLTQTSPIRTGYYEGEQSQLFKTEVNKENPAQLIEVYSKKLFKVQLYLQANKNKLGSMLCRKFQQILNQIVQSLVDNLKKSLNQLEIDIQNRLTKQFQRQFDTSMMQKEEEIRTIEKVCEKITKKFGQLLHKQHYNNSLIYNLRLRGIDIDNEFGRAVWNVDNLGGLGYGKTEQFMENESQDNPSTHRGPLDRNIENHSHDSKESSCEDFEFRQHPSQQKMKHNQFKEQRQEMKRGYNLTFVQREQVNVNTFKRKQPAISIEEEGEFEFRLKIPKNETQSQKRI